MITQSFVPSFGVRRRQLLAMVVGAGLVIGAPSACSDAGQSKEAFTGPWAAEFEDYYAHASTDFGRSALSDGVITDQELQEGLQIVRQCYANNGYSVEWDKYGYSTARALDGNAEDGAAVLGACDFADDGVHALYYQMTLNPGNRDDLTIRAECLVEVGLVPAGFTGADLEKIYLSNDVSAFPWDIDDPKSEACLVDPLGVMGG